ncbi:MAG: Glu-tRNA(Gln) amidotransferase GatDE subunit E [Planctomycetota bacterium]|nr:MAG: Glu-tRNA(Gln) amidotransferase GatDE subunit E [Planctomycetota bacterium]
MDERYTISDPWLLSPLPIYGSLAREDYAALGFKCGLEVHQQLLTKRKLFCRCPAGLYHRDGEHDAEVLRHMRPTLSEMGEYDGTALMEFKTRKQIIYLLRNETVCTYEMDDAPPFEIDDVALDRSIGVAMMLGCNIVGEVHITRKQYLDGSIPTGFQRTAIIGTDGDIPYRDGMVHIRQISIEEDSCREVSDEGHWRVYRTDRLGMPLIETVTDPDMKTPEEAMEVGQMIRWLSRASGLVRTGSGTGRQDVNVSVTGGTRIEIKGVPSLRMVPRLTHNEALRQRSLVGIQGELAKRGVTPESIEGKGYDVTQFVRNTTCSFLAKALEKDAVVQAIPLPGFQRLLETETQPRTTFLKEFSDRIRVIACIDEQPNLLLSTQDVPTLSSHEWRRVIRACECEEDVPVIVVWGSKEDTDTAIQEIAIRAREACAGIPNETRQALDDGTTGFERILPGADRMYPDTDLPPIALSDERVDKIRESLPIPPWERVARCRELGVNENLTQRFARSRAWWLFEALLGDLKEGKVSPNQLASLLLDRHCARPPRVEELEWWQARLAEVQSGEILLEALWSHRQEPLPRRETEVAEKWFRSKVAEQPEDFVRHEDKREHALLGAVMPSLRGRVPGKTVRAWVKEVLS